MLQPVPKVQSLLGLSAVADGLSVSQLPSSAPTWLAALAYSATIFSSIAAVLARRRKPTVRRTRRTTKGEKVE